MIKKINCPHCGKSIYNVNVWGEPNENLNEFYCDDCHKIYILEDDNTIIEEDA
jgi:transposase-like protein